jgi:hypothetical protein
LPILLSVGATSDTVAEGDRRPVIPLFRARVLFPCPSVLQIKTATGDGAEALARQDRVSQVWINFARTGNPNQPALQWKAYTKEDPQAMLFGTVSEPVALRDDKLVSLLPAATPGARTGRGSA